MNRTRLCLWLSLVAVACSKVGADPVAPPAPPVYTIQAGFAAAAPDTRPRAGDWDGCSGYHYSDSVIYGFSHTHLSGTGCDDWCDILLLPGTEPSPFSHAREKASPGYYEVFLDGPQVQVRLTAGRRVGMHEYPFPAGVRRSG